MRDLLRIISGPWREIAQIWGGQIGRIGGPVVLCNAVGADLQTTPSWFAKCLNCYPSPVRYDPSRIVPDIPFSTLAENGLTRLSLVDSMQEGVNYDATQQLTGGISQCLKHHSFLQQLHSSALQLVSTMTQNVRLLAQALVVLLAKLSATTTVLKARLLAALSVHLPTTFKVSQHHNNSIKPNETAAAGQACVRRVCCLKGV